MSIKEYIEKTKQQGVATKVQDFIVASKRLSLGQHPVFNEKYLNLIIAYYKEHLSALEGKTNSEYERSADMYDMYNYHKGEYEGTYNKHCESYAKIIKLKGITEDQLARVDAAHTEVKTTYLQNVGKINAVSGKSVNTAKTK